MESGLRVSASVDLLLLMLSWDIAELAASWMIISLSAVVAPLNSALELLQRPQ